MSDLTLSSPPLPPLVLIADANPDSRQFLSLLVRYLGGSLLSVSDGAAALAMALIHAQRIVVALLDTDLPEITGVAVAEQLHRDVPNLPLLIMSEHISTADRVTLETLPVQAVFDKPLDLEVVRIELARYIGGDVRTVGQS